MSSSSAIPTLYIPRLDSPCKRYTTENRGDDGETSRAPSFLGLAAELRNLIYNFYCMSYESQSKEIGGKLFYRGHPAILSTLVKDPILHTSRQVRVECMGVLLEATLFVIFEPQIFSFLGDFGCDCMTTVRVHPPWTKGSQPPYEADGDLSAEQDRKDQWPGAVQSTDVAIFRALTKCQNLRTAEINWLLEFRQEWEHLSTDQVVKTIMDLPPSKEIMKLRGLKTMKLYLFMFSFLYSDVGRKIEAVKSKVKMIVEESACSPKEAGAGLRLTPE